MMDNTEKKAKPTEFGRKMGVLFATVCEICVLAIMVALTSKFIFWLLS